MRISSLQSTALRYFLEVARHGSLAGASRALHVAASAISRQVAGLERSVGQRLFDRLPRGMVLTPAGEILAGYARRADQEAERAMQDVLGLQDLHAGQVRVVASEGFASHLLPRAMAAFRQSYADIAFTLDMVTADMVAERVREGDADIGVAYQLAPAADIRVVYRQRATAKAVMRADHPLARHASLTLRQIAAYPLAVSDRRTTLRQVLDAACARQRVVLEPALETNAMSTLHAFVLAGGGLTLLSEVSLRHLPSDGELVAVPLKERFLPAREFTLQVLQGRTLPPAADHFLQFLIARLDAPLDAN